jgi:hypothetical protein
MSLEDVGPLGEYYYTTVEIIIVFTVVVEDTILVFRMEVLIIVQSPTDKVNRLTRILSHPNQ